MKPKLKSKASQGRKDVGELYICENGFRYKYYPGTGQPIDCFIAFHQVRNIFYEKFTEKIHTTTVCF